MATMTRHPAITSKLCTQMWGTGRSWLISSNKTVARMNHTVWLRYTNAAWRRKNWTNSIWDHMHWCKWWMTLYMVRYHKSSLSNAFKLKLGHYVKLLLVEMKAATGKNIAERLNRVGKVIPASILPVSYSPQPIRLLRPGREPMKMKEWWVRRQVGKRL